MIERIGANKRYAQMVIDESHVWIAGQIADDYSLDAAGQTKQVLAKIEELLSKAGLDRTRLVSATVWIADFADYASYNNIWEEWIDPNHLPARASVGAKLLDDRLRLEIAVVAKR